MPMPPFINGNVFDPEAALNGIMLLIAVYRDRQDKAEELMRMYGGGQTVLWLFRNDAVPPSLAVLRQGDDWWIVVAGTQNANQVTGHITGIYGFEYDLQTDVVAHAMYYVITKNQKIVLDTALSGATKGTSRIHLVAHSYGAAIAYLYANYLVNEGWPEDDVELLTFAGVKVLTGGYTGPTPKRIVRVCNEGDAVPWLPPTSFALLVVPKFVKRFYKLHRQKWVQYGQRWELSQTAKLTPTPSPENDWVNKPFPFTFAYLQEHYSDTYLLRLYDFVNRRYPETPERDQRLALALEIKQLPVVQASVPDPLPESYITADAVNRLLFPTAPGTVDVSNLNFLRSTASSFVGISVPTRNIGGLSPLGGIMPSGLWKITLHINNGEGGRSFSTVWNGGGGKTISDALTEGKWLAEHFSDLFGNSGTTVAGSVKDQGSPCVEFYSVTDPMEPRLGQMWPALQSGMLVFGPPGGAAYAADRLSTSISMKVRGVISGTPSRTAFSNFIINGQPDSVVAEGVYQGYNVIVPGGLGFGGSWDALLQARFAQLVSRSYGFMGRDPAVLDKRVTGFALNGSNQLVLTVPAHGYATNDVVRVKSSTIRSFNNEYRIAVPDVNTIVLLHTFPAGATLPTAAQVYKLRNAAGVPSIAFYAYQPLIIPAGSAAGVQVKFKRPGRQFIPVSFSKHGPRAKI